MIRRPVRPSLAPIPRYTPLRPVGPAKAKRTARYKKYLASATWRRMKQTAIQRTHASCERCHDPVAGKLVVEGRLSISLGSTPELHHLTYARFGGDERPSDLILLCRSCHRLRHRFDWWKQRGRYA
jgi:5-methylcytosine-specific restriction endonuclease McrA